MTKDPTLGAGAAPAAMVQAAARAMEASDRARYPSSDWDRLFDRPDYRTLARVGLAAALDTCNLRKETAGPTDDEVAQQARILRSQLEDIIGEAYEIGYAHGGNAARLARNEPPYRVHDGWAPLVDQAIAVLAPIRSAT